MFQLITGLTVFIVGLVIGSFSNVCIYRIPRNESIVFPASHCPACGQTIKWYDNIPLLSYIILKGKCRFCQNAISIQYPLVESLTGSIYLFIFLSYGLHLKSIAYMFFCSALIIITFIDLKEEIIPDTISISFLILGFLLSVLIKTISPLDSLLGIFVGGGTLLLVAVAGSYFFKKEAMGGGDIKLSAMVGSFLGWQLTLLSLFLAFFSGAIAGVIILLKRKEKKDVTGEEDDSISLDTIPFGPFIALGSVIALFFGKAILNWYFFL